MSVNHGLALVGSPPATSMRGPGAQKGRLKTVETLRGLSVRGRRTAPEKRRGVIARPVQHSGCSASPGKKGGPARLLRPNRAAARREQQQQSNAAQRAHCTEHACSTERRQLR
ncbi:hypothetical protein MTO96_006591 [Rhipicephalus appendiculatus]